MSERGSVILSCLHHCWRPWPTKRQNPYSLISVQQPSEFAGMTLWFVVRHLCRIYYLWRNADITCMEELNYQLVLRSNNWLQNPNEYRELWCLIEHLLCADRFDGDCLENNPEAALDKSKPWSRSIEDLHGGSTLPSPITGNGLTRVGRHSTLRYSAHA